MNKNITYIVVGIITLVLGSCAMLGTNDNKDSKNKLTIDDVELGTGITSPVIIEPEGEETSLIEEYKKTKTGNLKCTLHMEEEGGIVDQVVYISGLKMRMNSIVKYQGNISESHIINDGKYTYIWGRGGNFKMKNDGEMLRQMEEDESNDEYAKHETDLKKILEKIPNNNCIRWDVEDDIFELPKGIKFKDFSEGIKFDMDIEGINNTIKNMEVKNNSLKNLPKDVNSEQIMESIKGLTPDSWEKN